MATPIQYLDKAMTRLRDLGLVPEKTEEAPIVALLNRVSDLDNDKVVAIARTLSQASLFNQVVREQVASMSLGERYAKITDGFNSIRDDAKSMVKQVEDGRIDTFERLANVWQKATRGDIAGRFDKVKRVYLDVVKDSKDQIEREQLILQAYLDFRGALKESEVLALQVLKIAEAELQAAQAKLKTAVEAVEKASGDDLVARAKLELKRDEELRNVQGAEDRYQICKDLSDNLTIGYNTSEVIMARLVQTTNAKDRVYKQAVSFFGTNETVLTALSRVVHGPLGPAREHEDARRDEGRRQQEPRGLGRHRRQGPRSRAEGRLRPDDSRRRRQEARRLRRELSDPLARDHRRDARALDEERGRDPRRRRDGQAAPRQARRERPGARARRAHALNAR